MTTTNDHDDTEPPPNSGRSDAWKPITLSIAFAIAAWSVHHFTSHETGTWHYATLAITLLFTFFATATFFVVLVIAFFIALGEPNNDKVPSRRLVLTIRTLAAAAVAALIAADADHLAHTKSVLGILAIVALLAGICLTAFAFRKRRFHLWEQVCGIGVSLLILSNVLSLTQTR